MSKVIKKTEDYIYFDCDYLDLDNLVTKEEKLFGLKLKQDKRYLEYYLKVKSIKKLYDAGFFIEKEYFKNDFTEYFPKENYRKNMVKDKKNVVLIACGAFSPLHVGHIEMMNIAKSYVESQGYNVCGGIISPSHDNYVNQKRNGEAKMFILDRVIEAEKLIQSTQNDWLSIDLWEGAYVPVSINQTVVIDRIYRLLNDKEKEKMDVIFVFGSDNYAFRYIFMNHDKCICVKRNNTTALPPYSEQNELNVVLNGNTINNKVSSTSIRNNGYQLNKKETTDYFEIRNDIYESLNYLGLDKEKSIEMYQELANIFHKYVQGNPQILEVNVQEQIQKFNNIYAKNPIPFLSADLYIKSDIPLNVSRKFDYLSGQVQSKSLILRNGKTLKPFNIPKGSYYLIDDDITSGYTIQQIKNNLPKDVEIIGTMGLNDLVRNKNKIAFDIVDARDFILGAENCGLQVSIGHSVMRVPYFYPYVNLYNRASIYATKQKELTIAIYQFNINFYTYLEKKLNKKITVADLKSNQDWLLYRNYSKDTSILEILQNEWVLLLNTYC